VKHLETLDVPGGTMAHDCSITATRMVAYDLPVTFNLELAMSGKGFPYLWDDNYGARVGVLPLGGTNDQVQWFEVEPCYVFHPLNARDEGSKVVLDVVRYARMFDKRPLGPEESAPQLWRWTLDTATGAVTEEQLSDVPMEFPRVDERLVGREHRWGYASAVRRANDENDFGRSARPHRRQERRHRGHRSRCRSHRGRVGDGSPVTTTPPRTTAG
jgi:carotenoid cleavage dioxygenase